MKINNKGYASTIIMFSILTLFLISMLMLVKTMSNSSTLNKKITEKVVDNIDYGAAGTVQDQIYDLSKSLKELEQKVSDLNEQNENLNKLLNQTYTNPTVVNNSVNTYSGGYTKNGKLVIINMYVTLKDSNLSKNLNYPTAIFGNLPVPENNKAILYAATPKSDGTGYSGRFLESLVSNDTIVLSDSETTPYQAGWGIWISGVYIAKE